MFCAVLPRQKIKLLKRFVTPNSNGVFLFMNDIANILKNKIMVFDGAMGTMLQSYNLTEKDFRGERFKNHRTDLKGNNDFLCIVRPDIVAKIHKAYFDSGADIIETNTFNANTAFSY